MNWGQSSMDSAILEESWEFPLILEFYVSFLPIYLFLHKSRCTCAHAHTHTHIHTLYFFPRKMEQDKTTANALLLLWLVIWPLVDVSISLVALLVHIFWGGWGGLVGGRFKKEWAYVHLWLIHVDIWQKQTIL